MDNVILVDVHLSFIGYTLYGDFNIFFDKLD